VKKRSQAVSGDKTAADREREIDELFSVGTEPARSAPEPPIDPEPGLGSVDSVAGGALPPPTTLLFGAAEGGGRPKFPPVPELQRGFQEIVRDLFDEGLDVVAEYKMIRDALTIKDSLTPGNVQAAANRAEEMADRAYRLYLVALNEHAAYLREIAVIEAALRDSATAQLELEKAQKTRTKQITESDVDAMIAQLHPDEWSEVQSRKGHAKAMLNYLENLSDLSKRRCFTVSKMQYDK
jgi:hypothetical protein